jgi:hypothetical protein
MSEENDIQAIFEQDIKPKSKYVEYIRFLANLISLNKVMDMIKRGLSCFKKDSLPEEPKTVLDYGHRLLVLIGGLSVVLYRNTIDFMCLSYENM